MTVRYAIWLDFGTESGRAVLVNVTDGREVATAAYPNQNGVHSVHAASWAQPRREIPCLGTTHADHFHGLVPVTHPLSVDELEHDHELNTGLVSPSASDRGSSTNPKCSRVSTPATVRLLGVRRRRRRWRTQLPSSTSLRWPSTRSPSTPSPCRSLGFSRQALLSETRAWCLRWAISRQVLRLPESASSLGAR